jgi:hypothetical protein
MLIFSIIRVPSEIAAPVPRFKLPPQHTPGARLEKLESTPSWPTEDRVFRIQWSPMAEFAFTITPGIIAIP